MAFVVICDACVLYPNIVRDVLIRVAMAGTVRARWTEAILDETFRNPRADRPDLDPDKLSRTRELMCKVVPDCLVTGYESLIDGLVLPDPEDRHVLAAAVRAGAQLIVTSNLKDFPGDALAAYGVEGKDLTTSSSTSTSLMRRCFLASSQTSRGPGSGQEASRRLSLRWSVLG